MYGHATPDPALNPAGGARAAAGGRRGPRRAGAGNDARRAYLS